MLVRHTTAASFLYIRFVVLMIQHSTRDVNSVAPGYIVGKRTYVSTSSLLAIVHVFPVSLLTHTLGRARYYIGLSFLSVIGHSCSLHVIPRRYCQLW